MHVSVWLYVSVRARPSLAVFFSVYTRLLLTYKYGVRDDCSAHFAFKFCTSNASRRTRFFLEHWIFSIEYMRVQIAFCPPCTFYVWSISCTCFVLPFNPRRWRVYTLLQRTTVICISKLQIFNSLLQIRSWVNDRLHLDFIVCSHLLRRPEHCCIVRVHCISCPILSLPTSSNTQQWNCLYAKAAKKIICYLSRSLPRTFLNICTAHTHQANDHGTKFGQREIVAFRCKHSVVIGPLPLQRQQNQPKVNIFIS